MKKLFVYLGSLLCGLLIFFTSCSNKDVVEYSGSQIGKCLMAKDFEYEKLLTKADVTKYVAIEEASYKMKTSAIKGQYGYCSYEWLSDRPDLELEVAGQLIKGPDKNRVKLTMLDFYTDDDLKLYSQPSALALFDQSYKKLSQAEYDELLANLKKEYAGDAAGYQQAKGFLDVRMNFTFRPVENLGDRAYWKWHDTHGIELVVLSGASRFTIESKTSGDAETAMKHAVNFAREVLAKCE